LALSDVCYFNSSCLPLILGNLTSSRTTSRGPQSKEEFLMLPKWFFQTTWAKGLISTLWGGCIDLTTCSFKVTFLATVLKNTNNAERESKSLKAKR
jgi:hypothetical protein